MTPATAKALMITGCKGCIAASHVMPLTKDEIAALNLEETP